MADLPKYPGIRNRRNKVEIYFNHDGKRYTKVLDLTYNKTNLEAARKALADWKHLIQFGPVEGTADDPLFLDLAQTWLDTLDRTKSTVMSYYNLLEKYWIPELGHLQISAIRYSDLLRIDKQTDWSSPKTRKNALIPLRGVFDLAMADNLRPDNPASRFKKIKHQKPEVDPFTIPEWLAIRQHLTGDALRYFSFLYETGMRHPSELNALTWQDWIDGPTPIIQVSKSIVRRELKTTKTNKPRNVRLTQAANRLLREHPGRFMRSGPIFPNTQGNHQMDGDLMNQAWRAAVEKAGVRYRRAYNLRHTYASVGLTAGLKPGFIADQLGHSVKMTLEVYGKYMPSSEDDAQLKLMEAAKLAEEEKVAQS